MTVCQIHTDAHFLAFSTNLKERKEKSMNRKTPKETREEIATRVFWANLCEESGSSNINEYHAAAVDQNCLNIRFTRFWEKRC